MADGVLVIDFWSGNQNLDHPTIINAGVKGAIPRLNSISGGHHLDSLFIQNWKAAQGYKTYALYFVYSPFLSGIANYNWLMANLPAGYKGRIFFDVEVSNPGYSPNQYAVELLSCITLVQKTNEVTIYSGAGSYSILSPWPKLDYWWAQYYTNLYGTMGWTDFVMKLLPLSISEDSSKYCAGSIKMWQVCGDNTFLPGFGGHPVDVSVFFGTEDELVTYFGNSSGSSVIVDPTPDPIVVSGSPIQYKTINTMNVRSAPSLSAPILGQIAGGTIVNTIDIGGVSSWIEIESGKWICHSINNTNYLLKI